MLLSSAVLLSPFRALSAGLTGVVSALVVCLGVLVFPVHTAAQSDLTVSVERQEARAGESVDVPLQVTDFANVGAISLIVTYDPDVLAFAEDAETRSLIAGTPRDNFSANVVEPGELRISWFDTTGSSPMNIDEGTLLTITFHRYAGGESPVAFAESSEISNIEAKPLEATFQDGRVVRHP